MRAQAVDQQEGLRPAGPEHLVFQLDPVPDGCRHGALPSCFSHCPAGGGRLASLSPGKPRGPLPRGGARGAGPCLALGHCGQIDCKQPNPRKDETIGEPMAINNRITELLGVEYPIVQAPMGWIARAQLASAVSNAGGLGVIETSSGRLDEVREEVRKMRTLTSKPFGVNIAQAFVRDPDIVSFVVDQGVKFVTTSAGDPNRYCSALKAAGLTVFHVVPSLAAALKAIEAGVDGLVVEGGEGGGFKNGRDVASMVLLPLVCSRVKVPVIAAGGIVDGRTMLAAFALGAEGVQMGTRMVSAAESPVHGNWKTAILEAKETDTVFLNRFGPGPALRALRTEKTSAYEKTPPENIMAEFGNALDLYFGGDMEASIALSGQVAGRIDEIKPVAQVIAETVAEFEAELAALQRQYGRAAATA
ncbi:NAD(P)H-dependent flavin oxidoreductase [Caulobacter sp. KR2-114]|uniref:NAD(P)H-dependent flavin oxidoreductase n=1 Tax=Caulobacter sp. KR2-114 TaxID=3400912 RepID=UPI003C1204C7